MYLIHRRKLKNLIFFKNKIKKNKFGSVVAVAF